MMEHMLSVAVIVQRLLSEEPEMVLVNSVFVTVVFIAYDKPKIRNVLSN